MFKLNLTVEQQKNKRKINLFKELCKFKPDKYKIKLSQDSKKIVFSLHEWQGLWIWQDMVVMEKSQEGV